MPPKGYTPKFKSAFPEMNELFESFMNEIDIICKDYEEHRMNEVLTNAKDILK